MNGRDTRSYVTTALTAAALVLAALASILAGTSHGSARAWWIAVNLLAVAGAVVAQAIEQRRRERERRAVETVAIDMRVAMNDALDPIVRQLGKIAVSGRRDRDELREQTVPMVLYSAALLIGPDRVRACWFELDERAPRALRPVLHEGRAGGPRTTFVEGTVAGDSVFELLTANAHRFCKDVHVDPPPGWDATHPHDYQTFLAVPVVAGTKAFGLLTVDSLVAGDLTEGDVPLLRLLAGLLADALAYGS
jgi:hypothetical protein